MSSRANPQSIFLPVAEVIADGISEVCVKEYAEAINRRSVNFKLLPIETKWSKASKDCEDDDIDLSFAK